MTDYELIPNMNTKFKPAFATREEYEHFREEFEKEMTPITIDSARRHAHSNLAAMSHWVD